MAPGQKDEKARIILDAVRGILARKGYSATTINLVATEAGVSRGLLHYYFRNKEEMLARVLKENMLASIAMIHQVFTDHDSAEGFAKGITDLLRTVMTHDPDFFHLFFEGFSVARQSSVVKEELTALYGQFRIALESCLIRAKDENKISPVLAPRALAAIITGIMDGMGLQFLTEADLCADKAVWDSIETAVADLLITGASSP